ncbi:MAG: glycosyltransferase family 2 protein [Candidatus Bathyarchaeota archaeon]|jgi:glycosyltransferase involved in cell wall biosynthesis
MTESPLISVICCAHNEEAYIDESMPSLLKALQGIPAEVLFIADRCTDNTVDVAKRYSINVIEKTWKKWENSYAEALQTGYHEAKGTYVSILDPDILVPTNFFQALLPLVKGEVASVAADVVTYPDTFWNRVMYAWEKTYSLAPLGKEPYGASRLILASALDEIGGFQDVPAPDTNLDMRLAKANYKSVAVPALKTFHLRQLTLGKMISGQVRSGRARYVLGLSFKRTVGHSILRIRPLILQGWMLEWMNRKTTEQKPAKNN